MLDPFNNNSADQPFTADVLHFLVTLFEGRTFTPGQVLPGQSPPTTGIVAGIKDETERAFNIIIIIIIIIIINNFKLQA